MKLIEFEYSQFPGTKAEWVIPATEFGDVNLIVGKNANGKTRTINVISGLAGLMSGKSKATYASTNYKATFLHASNVYKYVLRIENACVTKEELKFNNKVVFSRSKTGRGKIFADKVGGLIDFQIETNEIVLNTKRDAVQHPRLNELYAWAESLSLFRFGTSLGKDSMLAFQNEDDIDSIVEANEHVISTFRKGEKIKGEAFKSSVISKMKLLGYHLTDVGVAVPVSLKTSIKLLGLYVKEKGIGTPVDQNNMSQGMFRALALLIQIEYFNVVGARSGILIDDIGEGLDFDRSSSLIKLLVEEAEAGKVQLIMSTNDRFVMNNVDLKYWNVIQRIKNGSKIYNMSNSKKIFQEFTYTGLNNFDFFSKNFLATGLK